MTHLTSVHILAFSTLILVIGIVTKGSNADLTGWARGLFSAHGCNKDLMHLDYEYHGTKTTYGDARRYIEKFLLDGKDLPPPFDNDQLTKEHFDLRRKGCAPIHFYFVGRHSARFPDSEDIKEHNATLNQVIEILKSNQQCLEKRKDLIDWRSKMVPAHDSIITELGAQEEGGIAQRFKHLYEDHFDTALSNIRIGVSKKLRTSQTAVQFLREVGGLDLPNCNSRALPTNDINRSDYDLDKVLNAECYKGMIDKYEIPWMEFHQMCGKISGKEKREKDARAERVKNPQILKRICDRVANKLGIDNKVDEPLVTPKVLLSIYSMCKFENALKDDSVWCNLFEKNDVQALEYIEDVVAYYRDAYGPFANTKQSCPMMKDLLGAFRNITRPGPKDSKLAQLYSTFYFTHAPEIKKLLSTFDLFRDDDSFSDAALLEFERDHKVPEKRLFRTSVITPFSANMAFIMYRCQGSPEGKQSYKMLTTVTEQPVKLGGCNETACDMEQFFAKYGPFLGCDLNKICIGN